jgi:hypothetical protein
MPTICRPGQNVFGVLKSRGSQCAPSCEVQIGVEEPSDPTATKPRGQRSIERTRPNGTSAANFRQSIAVHAASADGGTGRSKAARGGPAGSAVDGALVGATVAEGTELDPGVSWGVADATGDATGRGEVVLAQPASATTTSATTRFRRVLTERRPSVLRDACAHLPSTRVGPGAGVR